MVVMGNGEGGGGGGGCKRCSGAVEWLVRQGQLPTGRERCWRCWRAAAREGEAPAEPPLELEVKNAKKNQGKPEAKSSGGSAGACPLRGAAVAV